MTAMTSAPEIAIESSRPAPAADGGGGRRRNRRPAPVQTETVVVIGNGMAGHKFCESMVAQNLENRFRLVVFGEERHAAYDRVHLTQFFQNRSAEDLRLAPADWYARHRVTLHVGDSVVAVDVNRRVVRAASGREVVYDRLVFATGSRPWVPDIPGVDLPGVFVYRTIDDLEAIHAYAQGRSTAAVMGGGLLGLEAAKALADLGLKTRIIERGTSLLARQLDPEAAVLLQEHVEAMGIVPMLQRQTLSIQAAGKERLLCFNTGEFLRTELVVIAAGVRPRDELADACGLELGPRGGIRVDDSLRTSVPGVFAVGECASHNGVICGLAAPSLQMADVLAANFNGARRRFLGVSFSTRLKLPGIEVATLGDYQQAGDTLKHRSATSCRRLVLDRGRVVGAVGIGPWPDSPRVQEVIERRAFLWPWQRQRFEETGRLWNDPTPLPVSQWPATALVCNCTGVRCGQLLAARAEGCKTVEQLAERTRASTVCGSCRPLLAELVGAEASVAPVRGSRLLVWAAASTFLLVAVLLLLPRIPMADTVQGGWKLDLLWRDSFWKQVTGFSLAGVCVLSLGLSLRKRIRWLAFGDFGWWRAAHATLGVLTLLLLISHTGLRLGHNLNFVLMLNFLALAGLGAMAGAVTAVERRLSGPAARRVRSLWTGAHIAMTWPLPVLVLFHALAAYYF